MVALEDLSASQQTCAYGAYSILARCRNIITIAADPLVISDDLNDREDAYCKIAEDWATAMNLIAAAGLTPPTTEVATLLRWLGAILDMPEGDDDAA